jgi:thymidylate kinase
VIPLRRMTSDMGINSEGGRASMATDVAAAIDAAATGPVLVVGSLPPGGRDLDLLANPADCSTLHDWLESAGFLPWRSIWARFDGAGRYAVELASTAPWQTKRHDASGLFADAEPIPGFRHLVSPGPATVLLLAARGAVTRRGALTDKVRHRVSLAVQRDPRAWMVAEERAPQLGMLGALRLLRQAYAAVEPLSASARATALAKVVLDDGPLGAKARVLAGARPRRLRPAIISFSGLDGSGKSTQVNQLRECLHEIGVSSEVQWAGFKTASKLRAAIPLLDRPVGSRRNSPGPRDRLLPTAVAGSAVGKHAWVLVVVGFNTVHLWHLALRRRRGSQVLIFDRFSPDSMVKLDLHFHRTRAINIEWQRRLFTLISPKPDVGFLVDVSSEVAYSRRQEQTPDELANMAELYQEQVGRYSLHRLDGTQPAEELAGRIAVTAWRGLP